MWFMRPGVRIPSSTPYVTPTRTGAVLCHNSCEELELSGGETIEFSPPEMLEYIRYIWQHASISPRTYWCEFPYYTVIKNAKQHFRLGYRPEDLSDIEIIEQKAWEKHQSYLNRLECFPLDKAEYYLRLKEAHGVSSVRGLAKITGEDWSCIARVLRILELPGSIKDFLKSNKEDSLIVKLFSLRKLLDIIRQGEERLQLARFGELLGEVEK